MNLSGQSIIGGSQVTGAGTVFHCVNPATGAKLVPGYASVTNPEVDRAARLAHEAFASFKQSSGRQRADLLRGIAAELEAHAEQIVDRGVMETALTPARLQAETARTCFQLRLYGGLAEEGSWVDARIDHAEPQRKPAPKPDLRSMLRPIGPVAVFGASNFPLAYSVAGGDTASALAAGNPVVVKAHPAHPGTSELVGLLIQKAVRHAHLPEGVFSLLFDAGMDVGAELVRHLSIKAVGFTGSRRGGRALMDIAAARPEPIPVYAEMGSINPVFLLPGALAQRAEDMAAALHHSVTLGVGQFCTCPGLVVLMADAAGAAFLEKLSPLMSATAPGIMLHAGIGANYRAGAAAMESTPGVRGLSRVAVSGDACRAGAALFATSAQNFLAHQNLMDEVFGPSTLVVECGTPQELIAVARAVEGQLTASLHATDDDLKAFPELPGLLEARAGRLVFGGFPTGVEVCHAMVHGGPYPATSDGRSTSVGGRALARFARPVCYQNYPAAALPAELQESNPLRLWRLVDGQWRND